jgi:hypothetical protein
LRRRYLFPLLMRDIITPSPLTGEGGVRVNMRWGKGGKGDSPLFFIVKLEII